MATAHRSNIFSARFLPSTANQKIVSCAGDGTIICTGQCIVLGTAPSYALVSILCRGRTIICTGQYLVLGTATSYALVSILCWGRHHRMHWSASCAGDSTIICSSQCQRLLGGASVWWMYPNTGSNDPGCWLNSTNFSLCSIPYGSGSTAIDLEQPIVYQSILCQTWSNLSFTN